jgi:hypothetical protein
MLSLSCASHRPPPEDWLAFSRAPHEGCAHLAGTYHDRGEAPGDSTRPSLTRELFGYNAPWTRAERVTISFPAPGTLRIDVAGRGEALLSRTFTTESGKFVCDSSRAVVRGARWFAADVVSGRETVTIGLASAGDDLLARVHTHTFGVALLIIPMGSSVTSWYRFERARGVRAP